MTQDFDLGRSVLKPTLNEKIPVVLDNKILPVTEDGSSDGTGIIEAILRFLAAFTKKH